MKKILIVCISTLIFGCAQKPLRSSPTNSNYCNSVNLCAESLFSAITNNWKRPPTAKRGMRATLEVTLDETFMVKTASIKESSGNSEFDASAINAINSSSPFVQLGGLSKKDFKENFQIITFVFDPQDLIQ